jgi:hypothetical protein
MSRVKTGWATFILLLGGLPYDAQAGWSVDVESGVAFNGYNDVRIPGTTGTNLSLSEELEADGTGFIRVRLAWEIGERHRLSLLVAPLRIEASGSVGRDVDFNGVRFASGERLSSLYRFDSYRVTYRYSLHSSDRLRAGLGLTAKVRDASIRIEGGGQSSENTNTGFVPLVNFAVDWRISSKLGLIFEGDALAAPQGRAEDVLLALYGCPVQNLRLRIGYRILEGGVDVDDVYNFTLIHYLAAGATWSI